MVATRGTPLQGDRSAHDMTDATKHASDIENSTPLYHWTQAEIENLASGASDLDGLDDVIITSPTAGEILLYSAAWLNSTVSDAGISEIGHTHTESDITDLATDDHNHNGSAASGGQLDWDNIWSDAVHDHSSDAEGGIFDAAILGSSTASDGYVLTADGLGGAAWEELTPGASALDDLTDVNAPAPNDGDVLTWLTDEWIAAAAAGGAGDASDLTFTPSTVSDWDGGVDPGNADDAFDQLADRLSWLESIGEEWDRYLADAATLVVGGTASAVSDLQVGYDGAFYHIDEVAETPAINLIVDFENITDFNYVHLKAVYRGSVTHAVAIQLYNWTETRWDTYDSLQGDEEDVSTADGYITSNHSFLVFDSTNYIGIGGDAGNVRLRFYHTMSGSASHDIWIDLAELVYIPRFSSTSGGASDAADMTYTPAVATDWDDDADPGGADDALDQLAERVDDLEAAGPGGGATNMIEIQVFL